MDRGGTYTGRHRLLVAAALPPVSGGARPGSSGSEWIERRLSEDVTLMAGSTPAPLTGSVWNFTQGG
jgi:hypothetical protein